MSIAAIRTRAPTMSFQQTIEVGTRGRGTYEITDQVADVVRSSRVQCGLAHVFVQHTSCSVMITENADRSVRDDLEMLATRWAPDGDAAYRHDTEGDDDMAAHARSIVAGVSISIPVGRCELLLGTWQGVYLWEHRAHPHVRRVVITVIG
jgi:secondary thiamine-phosphate synthase enzyme